MAQRTNSPACMGNCCNREIWLWGWVGDSTRPRQLCSQPRIQQPPGGANSTTECYENEADTRWHKPVSQNTLSGLRCDGPPPTASPETPSHHPREIWRADAHRSVPLSHRSSPFILKLRSACIVARTARTARTQGKFLSFWATTFIWLCNPHVKVWGKSAPASALGNGRADVHERARTLPGLFNRRATNMARCTYCIGASETFDVGLSLTVQSAPWAVSVATSRCASTTEPLHRPGVHQVTQAVCMISS